MTSDANRRDFLKAGAVVTATTAAASLIPTAVHAAGDDVIKVGVVGCGGRGSGAIKDCLQADKATRLHAIGDVFEEVAGAKAKAYTSQFKERADLGDRVFGGLDAYKKVIDSGVDLVILATPPGFRPPHLEYAVKARKHVFTEKPVAVDGPGIKRVLALVEESKRNGTAVVAGTQRRHQAGYIETVNRIRDGAIGDVVSARCSWNGQGIWFKPRTKGESDAHYQIRNWYHFLWVCGDHIVEQHVHNLDVINWVMGAHPVKAQAIGGRSYRKEGSPEEVGNIWDHYAVEFEYPNGVPMTSFCAHIPGIKTDISEAVFGTKGSSQVSRYTINKEKVFGEDPISAYVQEHIDLIRSIRSGKPLNELQSVTESTMTAILGREAAYTGDVLTWDQVLNAKQGTMPESLTMESSLKTMPVPVPDKYKLA
jgi:myo-inositol 2-dehydrogenase / D-chiro-inositol 1-dehydrogenase